MHLRRSSGLLVHPTSLPGPSGIGEIGPAARRFVDTLDHLDQTWWQVLPIGPTGYGDSPYQSPSTFAGNPLLVSLEDLGAAPPSTTSPHRVDYGQVIPWKQAVLAHIAEGIAPDADYAAFRARHGATWLDTYALYAALKHAHGQAPWWDWEEGLRLYRPDSIASARRRLRDEIETQRRIQFLFDAQWRALRAHCRDRGIGIIGDLPIFVAHDSADVWSHRDLFLLDDAGTPRFVAGVPPDYFSPTGQRWGNPLYDWERHRQTGFRWWIDRVRRSLELFDLIRIDHFRGFVAAWHIPADEPTAEHGEWVPAPGRELFDTLTAQFGDLPFIAENLGVITPEVEELRRRYGLPGMKVLQFGFGADSDHAPDRVAADDIVYTGTHDNDTTVGWFDDPSRAEEHRRFLELVGGDGSEPNWDMIRLAWESPGVVAMAPLQDVLGLGSEARMNTPATVAGNWRWRFTWDELEPRSIERLRILTVDTGRRKEHR